MRSKESKSTRAKPVRAGVVLGAIVFGLLFWARLIVVSDMPRTAIADDEEHSGSSAESVSNKNAIEAPHAPEATAPEALPARDDTSTSTNAAIGEFGAEAGKSTAQVTEDRD